MNGSDIGIKPKSSRVVRRHECRMVWGRGVEGRQRETVGERRNRDSNFGLESTKLVDVEVELRNP